MSFLITEEEREKYHFLVLSLPFFFMSEPQMMFD